MPVKKPYPAPSADESAVFLATNSAHRAARQANSSISKSASSLPGARLKTTCPHANAELAAYRWHQNAEAASNRSRCRRTNRSDLPSAVSGAHRIAERLRHRGNNTHTPQRLGIVSREASLIQGSTERVYLPQPWAGSRRASATEPRTYSAESFSRISAAVIEPSRVQRLSASNGICSMKRS